MSKPIKSIKTLKKHIGDTVRVDSYDGYTFDAKIVDNLRGNFTGLFTTDKAAEKDTYWWSGGNEGFCHIITKPYQLKTELKSLTLVEAKKTKGKVKKTAKTFVSAEELTANQGHYCEMADGTTGFIAGSKYPGHVCVLHNSEGPSDGWSIRKSGNASEIKGVTKSFIKKFSKGWHVGNAYDATGVKVAKILEEAVKPKKSRRKAVTLEDLRNNIGHGCTFKSGDKGYICESTGGSLLICFNTQQNGNGWEVDGDVPKYLHEHFKYAYFIMDDDCKKALGVASIDPEETDFQATESKDTTDKKKTVLDMTVRELLEKLNEIVIG